MNDYKELIKELLLESEKTWECDRDAWASNKYEEAADAIEQLVGYAAKCEKECEDAEKYIEQLVKERDTAVKCLPQRCTLCKHYAAEDGACYDERKCADWACHPNWEWRGVQE